MSISILPTTARGRACAALSSAAIAGAILAACGGDDAAPATPAATSGATQPVTQPSTPPVVTTDPVKTPAEAGRWTKGDLHTHTIQSDDAQIPLQSVLDSAFVTNGLDWMALTNHLRTSTRDNAGVAIAGGAIAYTKGMAQYEVPFVKQAQASGAYAGKFIFSGFEWDMPTHDHGNVGIVTDQPLSAWALKAANQFEYLFTTRPAANFDAADVTAWSGTPRANATHADVLTAIRWLKTNFPRTSYLAINHPSRNLNAYTAADLRDINEAAPDVAFMLEGMVGNQMEPNRGGYTQSYIPANLPNRTYGGVDYLVGKLGGMWDSMLGEGRRIWNVADSDYHFKTIGVNSSGYTPGEYAKTYVFFDGSDAKAWLEGLRSGRVFGVFGDLINALDFSVDGKAGKIQMGGELAAVKDEDVTVTIRFRSPDRNNRETSVGSGVRATVKPVVDHVDLIVGDVTGKQVSGSPGYSSAVNTSTRVLARFTKNEWTVGADGYNVITYKFKASKSQYLRLRGTNQGLDVAGETSAGEPLPDAQSTSGDFDAINNRNYDDLWFYSNPVFIKVAS